MLKEDCLRIPDGILDDISTPVTPSLAYASKDDLPLRLMPLSSVLGGCLK